MLIDWGRLVPYSSVAYLDHTSELMWFDDGSTFPSLITRITIRSGIPDPDIISRNASD